MPAIQDFKVKAAEDHAEFKELLSLNMPTDEQVDRMQDIRDTYRGHPLFEKVVKQAYDNYVTRDGCSCHITAPCSWCTRDIPQ